MGIKLRVWMVFPWLSFNVLGNCGERYFEFLAGN